MDKEDFVHKRNHDKGNFYSKDFTLEEVNQLIKNQDSIERIDDLLAELGIDNLELFCSNAFQWKKDAEKWRSMSSDLDTGGMWQIQQDRLELAEAIVEGLKKLRGKWHRRDITNDDLIQGVIELLQQPQRITSTKEGRKALADFEAGA